MTDDLLRRVIAKASEEALPPTATADELGQAERELGFPLPPLLRRLYLEVADGGFGPDYQLLSLREAVAAREEERWPAGVLPVLDWGCEMYAAIDCEHARATVLLYEPNGLSSDDDGHLAWYVDADDLTGWLETWLAEAGWYEEDAEETTEMPHWPPARERLTR
ncbi:SMI1/KNR4 family protein [Nonomuraea sp. NPDC050547]|uniref:SMI1/KNR4 family protein n=1 Tax=Nonomuraea sp. NPDC050547 TaxID=3364368 RepID=UPI0037B8D203